MIRLRHLRTERGWTLAQMAKALGVSIPTLSRIERYENMQQKYPLDEKVARPMLAAINKTFEQEYTFDDLEGVTIAPPRPGRPKKKAEEVRPETT